jgi:hypothetical protein
MVVRGKKPMCAELGDLVDRAKILVGRTVPKRKKEHDPDAYVRVVERPARDPMGRDPQPTSTWDDE